MGFIQTPDAELLSQGVENGNRLYNLEPGAIEVLAPGETFAGFAPTRPNQGFDPFVRMMLRGVAASLGLSYESLSRDYSNTSYSSARTSLIEERDNYRLLQGWLISNLHKKIFKIWLDSCVFILTNSVEIFSGVTSLYLKKIDTIAKNFLLSISLCKRKEDVVGSSMIVSFPVVVSIKV